MGNGRLGWWADHILNDTCRHTRSPAIWLAIHRHVAYVGKMVSTKLFKNGGNQAIRIPKRWSFDCDAVTMTRQGDALIIRPKKDDWSELEDLASELSADFMLEEAEPLEADPPVQFE